MQNLTNASHYNVACPHQAQHPMLSLGRFRDKKQKTRTYEEAYGEQEHDFAAQQFRFKRLRLSDSKSEQMMNNEFKFNLESPPSCFTSKQQDLGGLMANGRSTC